MSGAFIVKVKTDEGIWNQNQIVLVQMKEPLRVVDNIIVVFWKNVIGWYLLFTV